MQELDLLFAHLLMMPKEIGQIFDAALQDLDLFDLENHARCFVRHEFMARRSLGVLEFPLGHCLFLSWRLETRRYYAVIGL